MTVADMTALAALTMEERRLVLALREIPPSPLRESFATLVSELIDFVARPSCAEMQADGVPCPSAETACDECRRVTEILDGLRRRLPEG
jgi:hypothetical protein